MSDGRTRNHGSPPKRTAPLASATSGHARMGMRCSRVPVAASYSGFVIFSENTPFSFLFSFSVGKFSGRKFSGSPSSTASIVVLLVQPAPEEEDLTNEEGE